MSKAAAVDRPPVPVAVRPRDERGAARAAPVGSARPGARERPPSAGPGPAEPGSAERRRAERPAAKRQAAERRPAGRSPRLSNRVAIGLAVRTALVVLLAMVTVQGLLAVAGVAAMFQGGEGGLLSWLAASVPVMAAAVLAAWWQGHRLARRLDRIGVTVDRARQTDAADGEAVPAGDEIGRLADSVRQLADSVAERERRLIASALSDPLTGLPNRALLADRIRQTIALSQRAGVQFAVAVLDLDRFKFVNDTLGHSTGDLLLKEVARRIRRSVREADTVARIGGDEFVLVLSGDAEAARTVSRAILEAMRAPLRHKDQLIDIGVSIGIAMYPAHGQDEVTLLRHADSAMYRAKRARSGEHVFDGEGSELQRSYLSMLGEMREALRNGAFVLDFQPKLELASGRIAGLEGLVRWHHPQRGRVPPGEFIPFAEQTGFMREITRSVVEQGARFSKALADEGLDLCVSVNVSALDIENDAFARTVMEVLRKYPIDPRRLCLEITESGVVSESDTSMKNLRAIARAGVRLSVDDFGTGYATLKQLQRLPVNELKIDRSFVTGIQKDRGNMTIVRSTIELGKQLGLKVVAEGVETAQEMRCLARLGCDEIQGYHLARPMPEAEVVGWLRMRQALYGSSPSR
ncbi:EAL domain-containing protein [Burkholderiaceae bacterium FT117]|uniref:putative bifunctional diguanylate cyclase/phosphodiesterase n=1 Tax=Zeimonas sediminis TaxID=2944268 RepID=UPI002342FA62|nr:EAL domain-containing protein [Zeimonas sediminis]MCM5570136.1 EAL domain-containing protein [Zeimonas sediminis]